MKRTLKRQPLHFPARVEAFLERTEQHVRMVQSPTKMEFGFCALLYAWDALRCKNVHTQRWHQFWQAEAKDSTLAERCGEPARRLTHAVALKSFRRVRDGIKRVFQAVRERHGVLAEAGTSRVPPQARLLAEMVEYPIAAPRSSHRQKDTRCFF